MMSRKNVICTLGCCLSLIVALVLVVWEVQLGGIGPAAYLLATALAGLSWLMSELPYLEFGRKRAKRMPLTMRPHRQRRECKGTLRT